MIAVAASSSQSVFPPPPLGRSFVLGRPDSQGLYRVGLSGFVWLIPAGLYGAGDRVRVVSVEDDKLTVERTAS